MSSVGIGTGAEETAVAMRPPREERLTDGEKENLRYPRWQVATAPLSPEARLQLWSTYLLLYPETAHLKEISEALQAAQQELAAQKQAQAGMQQALQQQQTLNQNLQDRVDMLETGAQLRRSLWAVVGGTILLVVVMGIVGSI